ncbi:hypothetical protein RYR38_003491 [Edwardsiella piscicida]|nr:hypothetical protein [Edwardsiella piscicida]
MFRLDESSITASGIYVNTAGDKDITYRGNSIDIKGFLFLVRMVLRLGGGILVTKKPARGRLMGGG